MQNKKFRVGKFEHFLIVGLVTGNKGTFLALFKDIFMNKLLIPNHDTKKFPNGIAYDYSCSSVQDALGGAHKFVRLVSF